MASYSDFDSSRGYSAAAAFDAGLRAYMVRVYNWMAFALFLTAVTAYAVVHTSLRTLFFHVVQRGDEFVLAPTGLGMVGVFAPLAFVLVLSFGVNRLSRSTAQMLFVLYSVVMGISMASILMAYTGASVVRTFFITASLYGVMSLWGYVTKRSLMGMGSFLMMGLIGLVIASLVALFIPSQGMTTVISFIGVLIFVGFTAYDTQRIKFSYQSYASALPAEALGKMSVYDALSMYLNFVNLFQFLLQFTGTRSGGRD
ncbi:Bax inhibitor-1/YccA family protein [Bombella pollinis]|uniref:Bax inhibitor-1/YccA family protein n=1 Tax=Bombella pollinis TaxID=2967337 RepID=A0ABT3WKY9_9PROT|nr:Bax inhibitor-1/YccA family protein [Bombella pollinis]MCX5619797.1 Bax inhibitor-1/YccA family protein [Bombella pollinis]